MPEVSTFRLYLLRATYLLMVVGLGVTIWPGILNPPKDLALMRGVVRSVLGAVALLAIVGIRYPLKMLPLMFFELTWKSIWLLAFGLPLWSAHQLDPDAQETMKACLMGIIFPLGDPLALRAGELREGIGGALGQAAAGGHSAGGHSIRGAGEMFLAFEERLSDSPLVERVWRCRSGPTTSP